MDAADAAVVWKNRIPPRPEKAGKGNTQMTNIKKNFFANADTGRQLSEFEEKKMKELVEIYQGKIGM